jgi:hypothetical protein
MKIEIELSADQVVVLLVVATLNAELGCSPKRDVVISRCGQVLSRLEAVKAFDTLRGIGLINLARNGHCWLTERGAEAARAKVRAADHLSR